MRLLPILTILLLLSSGSANAQHATNFSAKDCLGVTHNLFDELDSGKVIVLCWVMPCSSCILPSKTAYNVTMSFETSHPGRVEMFICDDYANSSCATINAWANSNLMPNTHRFSDASIDMMDYGSVGMPKVVVVGGVWRKVYDNQNDAFNFTQLQDAIETALTETAIEEQTAHQGFTASIAPNPVQDHGVINLDVRDPGNYKISIYNTIGQQVLNVFEGVLPKGVSAVDLPAGSLEQGVYFIRIESATGTQVINLIKA